MFKYTEISLKYYNSVENTAHLCLIWTFQRITAHFSDTEIFQCDRRQTSPTENRSLISIHKFGAAVAGVGHRILNRFDPSAEVVGGLPSHLWPIEGAKHSAAHLKRSFIASHLQLRFITRLDEGEETKEGSSSNRKTAVPGPRFSTALPWQHAGRQIAAC